MQFVLFSSHFLHKLRFFDLFSNLATHFSTHQLFIIMHVHLVEFIQVLYFVIDVFDDIVILLFLLTITLFDNILGPLLALVPLQTVQHHFQLLDVDNTFFQLGSKSVILMGKVFDQLDVVEMDGFLNQSEVGLLRFLLRS